MAAAPNLLIRFTLDTLGRHAPFDAMDGASLELLASQLKLAYYPAGSVITSPAHGTAQTLYILQRGSVRRELAGTAGGADVLEYEEGECFPLPAVLASRATAHVFTSVQDTFCYTVDAETVQRLNQESSAFRAFAAGRVHALLQRSYAQMQSLYGSEVASRPMHALLRELLRREPVSCSPAESLRQVLGNMQRARVGSMVVVDGTQKPLGIFTDRDLLRHSAEGRADPARPIRELMTPDPRTLPLEATAAEAAGVMAAANIRHVVVVDDGRLAGVVSERDLFALQRLSMRSVADSIELASSPAALAAAAAGIRGLLAGLIAQDVGAEHLTQLIAAQNDRLARRIVELEAQQRGLHGTQFCWLALGSEGRHEQTLATDQDNAIVFIDAAPDDARKRLLPFAQAVNQTLAECGFPLCKGGVMAGNPAWCLSLEEWTEQLAGWVSDPTPAALLRCATFLDFRGLSGELSVAYELRRRTIAMTRDDERFRRALAQSALQSRPPGAFAAWTGERQPLDLKLHGTRPFVDAARVFALAGALEETGTAQRLRLSGARLQVPKIEVDAMVDAFHVLQMLRLRRSEGHDPNVVQPESLNEFDRRLLREAFRQARLLQSRLALDYRL
jgi:CBS domain-containing protein